MLKTEFDDLYQKLLNLFPDAKCELDYRNIYELCLAVMLSAQTTDKKVNQVTPALFSKYPDVYTLKDAKINDVASIIKSIGLYYNKAKNAIAFANKIVDDFNGVIPSEFETLITLPGIGRKTANVVLSEGFNVPRIAVDTHVERTSKRLGLSNADSTVLQVEKDLMNIVPKENWHKMHHLLIFFGRYLCKAQNPNCSECPFQDICTKYKVNK